MITLVLIMLGLWLHWVLCCECIPVVVKWSDDSYSSVDINTMSTVPEHPDYDDDVEVSDILTKFWYGGTWWTCIADFSFECNLALKTQHDTKCSSSQQDILHTRACCGGYTHTVCNLQSVLDVITKCTDTSKTALVHDNKISYLDIH